MKTIKYLLLFFFIFTISVKISPVFAQEKVDSNEQTKESAQQSQSAEAPREVPVEPEKEKSPVANLVTAIEIKGNKSISANTIISKLKIRIGSVYQENVLNDDIKRLYLLGFFSDIEMTTEAYKEGTKIIVQVVERPLIEKISFSGVKRLKTGKDKIKESLKSKEGQYLDYPNLLEDIKTIKKMYEKIGFTNAVVEYKDDINKEANKVKLTFNVTEGKRVRIKRIFFEGNKAFRTSRLLKLIKTRWAWMFNSGILKTEVLDEDMGRIKSFYRKNGYSDVVVEYELKQLARHPNKPQLLITIKVQEGKKYFVGSLSIKGNNDISEKDIRGKITETLPGKVFSSDAVKKDSENILGLYFDRGYISAQMQDVTSVNPETGSVNLTYEIVENKITYVNKINIKGNIKSKDLVIRRELRIKPGDRFNGEKLRRSKERLGNLGYFEEVNYDTQETSVSDKKDLVVDVKETKTGAFSFGGGYSTVDKLVGFVEIEQKNFDWKNFPYFTGAGQNLKARASFGTLSTGFDLSFTEPWLFDYPISFGFDAYKRQHERDADVGYGYAQDVNGGDVRLGKELSEYVRADALYRLETIKISDVSETASQSLKDEEGKNNISSVEGSLSFDTRDNVFDPTRGNFLSASGTIAGGALGGDKDFMRGLIRASHYVPMWKGSVIETKVRAGIADAYADSLKVPIYERFFAGGADTIRGYRERKIGPLDTANDPLGGEALLIGNIEYQIPMVKFFKIAFFYDIGNVWSIIDDFGKDGYKEGAGLGLRIKTPVGPLVLDYGIPLDIEPGEDKKGNGRLHFSMSHGF